MRADAFFGNVCELDLVFNFYKVYAILDEVFLAGEIEETSKHVVLARLDQRKPLLTLPRNIRTGTDTWWVWQSKNSIDPFRILYLYPNLTALSTLWSGHGDLWGGGGFTI